MLPDMREQLNKIYPVSIRMVSPIWGNKTQAKPPTMQEYDKEPDGGVETIGIKRGQNGTKSQELM
jgi:hypothetical protein